MKKTNNTCRKCKKREIPVLNPYHLHLCEDCLDEYVSEMIAQPVVIHISSDSGLLTANRENGKRGN